MVDTVKTTLYLTETPVPSERLLEALTRRRFCPLRKTLCIEIVPNITCDSELDCAHVVPHMLSLGRHEGYNLAMTNFGAIV